MTPLRITSVVIFAMISTIIIMIFSTYFRYVYRASHYGVIDMV
ncbi:hypothetical protein RintRC_1717 [Richelia intracellularis]|nr:hypothetical protein RintRC_1717 [Richelia intracellularis]